MSLLGGIASLAGGLLEGFMGSDKADEQSDVASRNEAASRKEAEYQQHRTSILLKRQKDYTHKMIGAQRAAYAKSGIQVDVGTARRMVEQTALEAAEDREIIEKEGAFNYERAMMGVQVYNQQASDIRRSGYIESAGSILTSGFSFAQEMKWI